MEVKQYKVQLKEGICSDIFNSPQEAMKKFGSNLARLIEYQSKVKKETILIDMVFTTKQNNVVLFYSM